jgi:hypothetical protein
MPPPPRSPAYPLDVTQKFTSTGRQQIGQGIGPVGAAATGALHDGEGDLRKYVLYSATRAARQEIYTVTAYADLIDLNLVAVKETVEQTQLGLQRVEDKVRTLQQSCDALKSTLQQIVDLLGGVTVPAWATKKEVEHGDEMGIVSPSAEELGVIVVYDERRQVPGFGHEDVVSTMPAAGTVVKRGSTVTVVINLEG